MQEAPDTNLQTPLRTAIQALLFVSAKNGQDPLVALAAAGRPHPEPSIWFSKFTGTTRKLTI